MDEFRVECAGSAFHEIGDLAGATPRLKLVAFPERTMVQRSAALLACGLALTLGVSCARHENSTRVSERSANPPTRLETRVYEVGDLLSSAWIDRRMGCSDTSAEPLDLVRLFEPFLPKPDWASSAPDIAPVRVFQNRLVVQSIEGDHRKVSSLIHALRTSRPQSEPILEELVQRSDGLESIKLQLRAYDVRDLITEGLRHHLDSTKENDGWKSNFGENPKIPTSVDVHAMVRDQEDKIQMMIADLVGRPEEWQSQGGEFSRCESVNGLLVIRTTPENHRGVAELLHGLRHPIRR